MIQTFIARVLHAGRRVVHFVERNLKITLIAVGAILVLVSILQLTYPSDLTMPRARIGDTPVGQQTTDQLAVTLQRSFDELSIEYSAGEETVSRTPSEIGASLRNGAMLKQYVEYPLTYRLIPFSIFWYSAAPESYDVVYNRTILESKSKEIAKELSTKPVDAGISIEPSGKTIVTSAKPGILVDPDQVAAQTDSASFDTRATNTRVELKAEVDEPSVRDSDVKALEETIATVLDQKISIAINDEIINPTPEDIASWVKITTKSNTLVVAADTKAIQSYLATLSKKYRIAPTTTVVTLVDGVEKSRISGKPGSGIDTKALGVLVASAITTPSPVGVQNYVAAFVPLASPVERRPSYTSSQAGLRAYVADTTADGSIKISVRQLGGNKWSADGGANDTVIEIYVGGVLTNYLQGRGFSSGTGFTFKEAAQTTSGDLAKLMSGIESGSLVSGDNRTRILSAMSRQVHRQGVPSGTSAPVYNKVGFIWDYLNDAAIVRHPKGTYVVTIMTKGESWGKIAEITRKVEELMYS